MSGVAGPKPPSTKAGCKRLKSLASDSAGTSSRNTIVRETGEMIKGNALKKLTDEEIAERLPTPELMLQVDARRRILAVLDEQIQRIEKVVQARAGPCVRSSASCAR